MKTIQAMIYNSDYAINKHIQKPNAKSTGWRQDPRHFSHPSGQTLVSGTLNMSPAWFGSGHDVRPLTAQTHSSPNRLKQHSQHSPLSTTPIIQDASSSGVAKWSAALRDFHALCTGIIRIMHPSLYRASEEVFKSLAGSDVHEYTNMWGLPFTAVSVISNRESIYHRDTKSSYTMYDMLATFGPSAETQLVLPDLNVLVAYPPGTVVGIAGRLIRHGVTREEGPRLCHAYYFRESVFQRCKVMDPGYMSQSVYVLYMQEVKAYLHKNPTQYIL